MAAEFRLENQRLVLASLHRLHERGDNHPNSPVPTASRNGQLGKTQSEGTVPSSSPPMYMHAMHANFISKLTNAHGANAAANGPRPPPSHHRSDQLQRGPGDALSAGAVRSGWLRPMRPGMRRQCRHHWPWLGRCRRGGGLRRDGELSARRRDRPCESQRLQDLGPPLGPGRDDHVELRDAREAQEALGSRVVARRCARCVRAVLRAEGAAAAAAGARQWTDRSMGLRPCRSIQWQVAGGLQGRLRSTEPTRPAHARRSRGSGAAGSG